MRLLFICSQGEHRSVRAAELYGGIAKAVDDVTEDDLTADIVFVMEAQHLTTLAERFPKAYLLTTIIDLVIPDIYDKDSPGLKEAIESAVEPWLE
jgi:predicted protein tyrosine phosphatase